MCNWTDNKTLEHKINSKVMFRLASAVHEKLQPLIHFSESCMLIQKAEITQKPESGPYDIKYLTFVIKLL